MLSAVFLGSSQTYYMLLLWEKIVSAVFTGVMGNKLQQTATNCNKLQQTSRLLQILTQQSNDPYEDIVASKVLACSRS